ncbi:hypothetical protein QYF61_022933 [Mycteria americana]|uniref:Uncharacterized protein n=1 Tax=Mycteria americana TaxID=33587 RepID=A0AAN7N8Y4_MYCAM|nr:hypothetical protein QYF61_022933 [Mycteria americana]
MPFSRALKSYATSTRIPAAAPQHTHSRGWVTWPSRDLDPRLYMLSMTSYGTEYPFGQLGSAVPAVSPPNLLCTPSLLTGGTLKDFDRMIPERKARKDQALRRFKAMRKAPPGQWLCSSSSSSRPRLEAFTHSRLATSSLASAEGRRNRTGQHDRCRTGGALNTISKKFKNIIQRSAPRPDSYEWQGTVVTPAPPVTDNAVQPGNQPVSVSVTPTHKKKSWKQKSAHLEREDERPGPSPGEEEEELVDETETT